MKPTVSVIITTCDRQNFVEKAIESVFNQDFCEYEVIVVDDGSKDNTPDILRKYKGINYFYQKNQGISRARNQGIELAKGEFISFLDSDDLWLPKKLSLQTEAMGKNPEMKASYTDEIWIRNGKRVNPKKKHQKYSGWIFERCVPLCIISPSSVMLRKQVFDLVGYFDENLPVCEDYDLWLRISARFPILFLDEKLIVKQGGHEDQLSHRFWGNDRFRVDALRKIIRGGGLNVTQRKTAIRELIKKGAILENGFRKRGKVKEAGYYLNLIEKYKAYLAS